MSMLLKIFFVSYMNKLNNFNLWNRVKMHINYISFMKCEVTEERR